MRFVIPGRPHGKRRPRVALRRGNRVVTYTPRETREYEERVAWEARAAAVTMIDGPVALRMWLYSKGRRRADIDNAAKSIMDGLNGVAYRDDSQVVALHVYAMTGTPERVEVEIAEAKEAAV